MYSFESGWNTFIEPTRSRDGQFIQEKEKAEEVCVTFDEIRQDGHSRPCAIDLNLTNLHVFRVHSRLGIEELAYK